MRGLTRGRALSTLTKKERTEMGRSLGAGGMTVLKTLFAVMLALEAFVFIVLWPMGWIYETTQNELWTMGALFAGMTLYGGLAWLGYGFYRWVRAFHLAGGLEPFTTEPHVSTPS